MAISCSEDFINPIFAVMAEPARAENKIAVITGPSSLINESATIVPTASVDPNLLRFHNLAALKLIQQKILKS